MIGAIAGVIVGSRFDGHPAPPKGFELFQPDCRFTDEKNPSGRWSVSAALS